MRGMWRAAHAVALVEATLCDGRALVLLWVLGVALAVLCILLAVGAFEE